MILENMSKNFKTAPKENCKETLDDFENMLKQFYENLKKVRNFQDKSTNLD